MAIVLVLVGQCGNQLGDELLTQLTRIVQPDTSSSSHSPFFSRRDGKARCVLVDTEPKVVHGVYARHARVLRRENVVCGQSGRGNNWAMGYYCGATDTHTRGDKAVATAAEDRYGDSSSVAFRNLGRDQRAADVAVLRDALRAVHRETRRTDDDGGGFDALVLVHSLAGGTGSGLGARLAQKLRYYFTQRTGKQDTATMTTTSLPHHTSRTRNRLSAPRRHNHGGDADDDDDDGEDAARQRDGLDGLIVAARRARHLISIAVAPLVAGELATQSINTALTLDVLLRSVDAVLLLRNDDTLGNDSSSSRLRSNSAAASFAHIPRCLTYKEANEVFVGLLLPLLHYGVYTTAAAVSRRQRRHGRASRCADDEYDGDKDEGEHSDAAVGVIGALVRQCVQHTCDGAAAADNGKDRSHGTTTACCCHRILTLLPLPQRSYVRYRHAALRVRTFVLHNTRQRMPGCAPATPPLDVVLCPLAQQQQQQQQHAAHARDDDDDDDDETTVSCNVHLRVPSQLLSYYALTPTQQQQQQQHNNNNTPVAQLYASLDGVAVVNQVRELNATLLLPLLRSAALKARVGAFLSSYMTCGVTADDVTAACRRVARVLADAEALTCSAART